MYYDKLETLPLLKYLYSLLLTVALALNVFPHI